MDGEDLERTKRTRAGHRAAATRLQNEAQDILNLDEVDEDSLTRLQLIAETLRGKIETLKELDAKLLGIIEIGEIETEISTSTETELRIKQTIKKIESYDHISVADQEENGSQSATSDRRSSINQIENDDGISHPPSSRPSSPALSEASNTSSQQRGAGNKTKLPKITLPKFSGEITKFLPFWESFESMVDRNDDLSQVDKFNYLQRCLEGQAARALEGLPIRDSTYKTAIQIIKERFGNKQKIISSHMEQLMKIKACENENVVQLRMVYDQIKIQIRGLEALGVTADKYGSLLIPVLMARLPQQISLEIARHTSQDVWSLGELMDLLRKEVEAREINEEVSVKEKKGITSRQSQPTAASLTTKTSSSSSTSPTCVFCNRRHFSAQCRTVTDINQRKEIVKKTGRCFRCLNSGHIAKKCDANGLCRICNRKHHTSLCEQKNEKKKEDTTSITNTEEQVTTATSAKAKANGILLQTARTYVFCQNNQDKLPVRILFDTGSHRSYISTRLLSRLGLKAQGKESLNLNTFGSSRFRKITCERVTCYLETLGGERVELAALSQQRICSPVKPLSNVSNFPQFSGLRLADQFIEGSSDSEEIDILIGMDQYHTFVTGEVIREGSLVAIQSSFGWILSGPLESNSAFSNNMFVNSNLILEGIDNDDCYSRETEIIDSFKQAFEQHTDETHEDDDLEIERRRFVDSCKIQFNGERYEVNLPFRIDSKENLSDNRNLCERRLKSLHSRLKVDEQLLESYDKVFQDQLTVGIIERVPKSEENKEEVFVLPHHGVVKEQRETTKLRIVFDASAKSSSNSLSLNDHLEVGPNYLPLLFDLLISFRSHPIQIAADIQQAFHQILIRETDRDFLRFYWFDDIKSETPSIVQFRFTRLPFGLTSSPAILAATLSAHINNYRSVYPNIIDKIDRFYVDDLITGCETIDEGIEIYEVAREITKDAGCNLRKWTSNSKELVEIINKKEGVVGQENTFSLDSHAKVLGVNWNTNDDTIFYDFSELQIYSNALPITKRSLLKITAKIFDPIGSLNPFLINLKCLFQKLALEKIPWDEELTGEFRSKYLNLLSQLNDLSSISIPRYYFKGKGITNVQLHGFSDASESAYASVIYIRTEYVDGEVEVKFVSSKVRVAPIKRLSIPRIELLGTCLLSKHINEVKSALNVPSYTGQIEIYLWTDSITSLCWIKNIKLWKQFVRNRVDQILKHSDRDQWRFCPGNLNPADIPSRGIRGSKLVNNQTWWIGPKFLVLPPSEWPPSVATDKQQEMIVMEESVKNPPELTVALITTNNDVEKVKDILDMKRYSNITKVIRVLAWVRRFISRCRKSTVNTESELSASEIMSAENVLIRSVQSECFDKELCYLRGNKESSAIKAPQLVSQFNLFIDDHDILRCRTGLKIAAVNIESREPILLPSKHTISELIMQHYHNLVFHNGISETLNAIRHKYWILRGRETVKKLVRRCITCKRLEGIAFKTIPLNDLPNIRVDDGPPFINTGIDFAGPLFIEDPRTKLNSKVYICLFTCMSTRAIHLELVENLTVDSFLCAFRRFVSRRGLPRLLISDNAKTFKSASKEVRQIKISNEVEKYLVNNNISWHFNVPLAAWQGGTWERLIRSVKRCLKKVIGRAKLTFQDLHTLIVEVECTINSRPITYVYDDTEGISYPLTPGQLISGYSVTRTPNDKHFEVVSTNESLTRRVKHQSQILRHFVKRWKGEYLLSLREVLSSSNGSHPKIEVGDVVVVQDAQTKRQFWKLGKVEELIVGKDGNVRAAKVRVRAAKGIKASVLTRALQHLFPLEIPYNELNKHGSVSTESVDNVSDSVKAAESRVKSNRRNAAVVGEINRRLNSM